MKRLLIIFISAVLVYGCSSSKQINKIDADKKYIEANLKFLAHDLLEGREAGTRGELLAAEFIAAELYKYGASTLDNSGSYFQQVPLIKTNLDSSSTFTFKSGSEELKAEYYNNFIRIASPMDFQADNAELVFAGYGISADEYNYDDYKNIDVKDKIAVVLTGEPFSEVDSFFAGKEITRYSSSRTKSAAAMQKGAKGLLIISNDDSDSTWNEFKSYYGTPSITLKDKPFRRAFPAYRISKVLGEKILSRSIDSLYAAEKLESFNPAVKINFNIKLDKKEINGVNVLGVIEGNDEKLKHEYVSIGAHYDHVGVYNGEVYNGADDNASGTSAVLETARLLAANKENKRSVLIAFYAAEEKGLLGSEYLVENLDILPQIVANINMDMVGRESEDSIYVIGSDKLSSEFHDIVNAANKETVNLNFNFKFNDENDPNRFYYRSDHYNFAKHNIPIVFFYDYMNEDYHQAGDESHKINFNKIKKITQLTYRIAVKTANLGHRLAVDKK